MANQLTTLTTKPAVQPEFSVNFHDIGEPEQLLSEAQLAASSVDEETDRPFTDEESGHDTVVGTIMTAIRSGCMKVFIEKGDRGNVRISLYK